MILLYILIALILLLAALLMLRLRVRVQLSGERRLLFVGLGRTGPELDLVRRVGEIRIAGITVRRFVMVDDDREAATTDEAAKASVSDRIARATKHAKRTRSSRRVNVREILDLVPSVTKALWRYSVGLLKSVIVEQAEGEIAGGFDEPDLTGRAYGYYQAALAAAPGMVGRVRFVPDWTGASFSGSMQISVALPLYQIVGRTIALIWRLPIMKIIRLVRDMRKGEDNVGQPRG